MAGRRFRYPLDALLRKRRADWKAVKAEETTAGRAVEHGASRVEETCRTIAQVEELLRNVRRSGAPIDLARQELLSNYLTQQRAELARRRQALQRARDVHERVLANLEGIGRGIKSLEKHRAGRQEQHALVESNLEQRTIDELWLLRSGSKPAAKR